MDVERKNYSFFMPDDFPDKIDTVRGKDDKLKALSRSQAIYAIVSEVYQTGSFTGSPTAASEQSK